MKIDNRYVSIMLLLLLFIFASMTINECFEQNPIKKNDIINEYLKYHNITKANIVDLGEYTNLNYSNSTVDETGQFSVNDTYYLYNIIDKKSKFDYNKDEIAKYSIEIVKSFEEIAYLHNTTLEDYYNNTLHYNKEEFYKFCFDEGLHAIENVLVIGAIADEQRIIVGNNDISNYLTNKNIDLSLYKRSNEIKVNADFEILKNKVTKFLKENNNALN